MIPPAMDLGWRQRGACRDEDPDLFFCESARGAKAAKAVCAGCPVRGACLEWVLTLDDDDRFGVAAGMTPRERAALRRIAGRFAS